jgi:hypothetical protein
MLLFILPRLWILIDFNPDTDPSFQLNPDWTWIRIQKVIEAGTSAGPGPVQQQILRCPYNSLDNNSLQHNSLQHNSLHNNSPHNNSPHNNSPHNNSLQQQLATATSSYSNNSLQ